METNPTDEEEEKLGAKPVQVSHCQLEPNVPSVEAKANTIEAVNDDYILRKLELSLGDAGIAVAPYKKTEPKAPPVEAKANTIEAVNDDYILRKLELSLGDARIAVAPHKKTEPKAPSVEAKAKTIEAVNDDCVLRKLETSTGDTRRAVAPHKKTESKIPSADPKLESSPRMGSSGKAKSCLQKPIGNDGIADEDTVRTDFDVVDIVQKRLSTSREQAEVAVHSDDMVPFDEGQNIQVTGNAPDATQPGAYSSAPGEDLQRNEGFDRSLVGRSQRAVSTEEVSPITRPFDSGHAVGGGNAASHIPEFPPIDTNSDIGLSRAFQVEDDPEVQAMPFDSNAMARRRTKERKFFCCFVVTLVVGASGLALALATSRKGSDHSVSLPPTLAPSGAPSESPSQAPSGSLDLMVATLPESTRQSMVTFGTPQWEAFEWLSHHPKIGNLAEWRKLQLFVLATFYHSMEGPNWRKEIRDFWLLYDKHECDWFSTSFGRFREDSYYDTGFDYPIAPCNDEQEYQAIFLEHLELSGYKPRLPPEIALLSKLSGFILENSAINATLSEFIPPEIYHASNITWLHLNGNKLFGPVSTELGEFTELAQLYLFSNSLTGTLPSEVMALPKLRVINVYSNSLSGTLPDQLPPELYRLELLKNQITGTIPTKFGFSNLTYIDMKQNLLTGPLPSELGLLTGMEQMFLHKNLLTGTLPTELGMMKNLYNLQLYGNSLWGTFPSELGSYTGLDRLRLQSNNLSGSLPSEMASMLFLNWLQLENNVLSGKLPEGLWRLPRLQHVFLHGNFFTGSLSTDVGSLADLQFLNLDGNSLTGQLPSELGRLGKLEHLKLHGNNCSGSIPTEFGNITSLAVLVLGSNSITGRIPSELGLLEALAELDLSDSLVSGTIPKELGELANSGSLSQLKITGTGVRGTIPNSLCRLDILFDCSAVLCGCDCECVNGSAANGI